MKKISILILLLFLSACSSMKQGDMALSDTTWVAEDINGQGVIDYLQTSISFEPNGEVKGFGGCNDFFGTAALTGNELNFSPMGATRKMCAEAISHQEMAFFQALSFVRSYGVMNGLLYLYDDKGDVLIRLWQRKEASN